MYKRGHEYPGLFISFEGPDGSGKTTQFRMLFDSLREEGYRVTDVRGLVGPPVISREIGNIILNPAHEGRMDHLTELFLHQASHAQQIAERILPALQKGEIVLANGYSDGTVAHYHGALNIKKPVVDHLSYIASKGISPDRTFTLDVPEGIAAKRMCLLSDKMTEKGSDYFEAVRKIYHQLAEEEPARIEVIDSTPSQEEVGKTIRDRFQRTLKGLNLEGKLSKT